MVACVRSREWLGGCQSWAEGWSDLAHLDVEPEILDHDELDALRQLVLDPLLQLVHLRGKL